MLESVIQLDGSKCKACYSCVRACPVKAIHVRKNSVFPHIDESRCIMCGVCIGVCAYHAISYVDSTKEVKALLNAPDKVAAVCAPSIAGEFSDITDYRKFVKMIRLLGFSYVNEMSFGVDIVAKKYKECTEDNFKGKYYVNSTCPSIVNLIEKFYPELIGNLVPTVTPAAATAIALRKIYGENLKIVHITPCIAAKKEVDRLHGLAQVDAVLTFQELRKLFREFNIKETFSEFSDFDEPLGNKGALYAIAEGFMEATGLEIGLLKGKTISVEGKENALAAVEQFIEHNEEIKRHISPFFCEGCIMGPGTSKFGEKYLRRSLVVDYTKKRLSHFDEEKWAKDLAKHSNYKELRATFKDLSYELPPPSDFELKVALYNIVQRNNNKEINCGACGYETCRGLAKAIAQNIAIPEMCVTYSQVGNREATHSMKKVNEELDIARNDLKTTRKLLEELKENLIGKDEALSILVRRISNGLVFVNEEMKIVESNLGFVELLGEDVRDIHEVIPYLIGADLKTLLPSVLITQLNYLLGINETGINRDVEIEGKLINVAMFQLIPNKLVGAIFRNLHSKEERPEEIINRVQEVIEENLLQVQQIGFILGEGAAKTEKMLNTIIKSYK